MPVDPTPRETLPSARGGPEPSRAGDIARAWRRLRFREEASRKATRSAVDGTCAICGAPAAHWHTTPDVGRHGLCGVHEAEWASM